MKRPGPLLTLLTGLGLAVVLLVLNVTGGSSAAPAGTSDKPAAGAPVSPSGGPSASAAPAPPPDADYAARTDGAAATVALSVQGGRAVSYVCDGRSIEAWLRGTVKDNGEISLKGDHGARMTAQLTDGKVTGSTQVEGHDWTFTAPKVDKPSGLYRAAATVSGVEVEAGWVVLQDRRQVGVLTRKGEPSAAPELDLDSRTVILDGKKITAEPVDGGSTW